MSCLTLSFSQYVPKWIRAKNRKKKFPIQDVDHFEMNGFSGFPQIQMTEIWPSFYDIKGEIKVKFGTYMADM